MATENKRDADTQSESEQVCKKLKEEVKNNESPVVEASNGNGTAEKAKTDIESSKESNNNVNNSKNEDVKSTSGGDHKKSDEKDEAKPKSEVKPSTEDKTKKAADVKSGPESQVENESETGEEPVGTFLICGGMNWDMTGRKELPKNAKKTAKDPAARSLWEPHKVILKGSDKPLRVKGVFSGCNACHSVIITDDDTVMTFGRNDKGQLGLGDTDTRITPVIVEKLSGLNIIAAACGRSHTLFLTSDGIVYACGDNKMGQCGTNQQNVAQLNTPSPIVFKENKPIVKIACGAEFSMILDNEGRLYSFGHPEHGQLGHNSEGKYFTSGNKYAFHCEYVPRRIVTYIKKTREGHVVPVDNVKITDVACGTNHTLAVDKLDSLFSWGFAGYHRLGHSETKNELVPRSVKLFDAPDNPDRGAKRVYAGSTYSMCLDVHGLLYFWGQNKSSGEATMYPKHVQDLCGWKIQSVSCANRSIFVVAEDICISWGPSPTYGELGYGEGRSKSSTTPEEVKSIHGAKVLGVSCGFGHSLLICRDTKPDDQTAISKMKSWP